MRYVGCVYRYIGKRTSLLSSSILSLSLSFSFFLRRECSCCYIVYTHTHTTIHPILFYSFSFPPFSFHLFHSLRQFCSRCCTVRLSLSFSLFLSLVVSPLQFKKEVSILSSTQSFTDPLCDRASKHPVTNCPVPPPFHRNLRVFIPPDYHQALCESVGPLCAALFGVCCVAFSESGKRGR